MSQQLRQLKTRIKAIDGIWKVTRAMEMVALSKFKAIESPLTMSRLYFEKLSSITHNLIASIPEEKHPFLSTARPLEAPHALFVVSTDTGLCGGYNAHLHKTVMQYLNANSNQRNSLYALGRKASTHFTNRGLKPVHIFPSCHGKIRPEFFHSCYDRLAKDYLRGNIASVHVAYTSFYNPMKHHPTIKKLLPVERPEVISQTFELETGDQQNVLSEVLPLYVAHHLRLMIMESLTSEFSARMVAMKASKDSAKELMGDLILLRNKIRQAVITKEVVEIISSSEALKG